jgi:hypothetical protein
VPWMGEYRGFHAPPPAVTNGPLCNNDRQRSSYWQRCGTFAKFPPEMRFVALLR